MRVLSSNNYDNNLIKNLHFKRKPTPKEYSHYIPAIKEGLKVLNKELGLIIHNSSVPSKAETNFGIGTLLSTATATAFIPFLNKHGITTIQQEPDYIRRISDPSPYNPISTSKNIYMIPLEKLSSEEYNFMLAPETLKHLKTSNDEKVDYDKINKIYEKALRNAYCNFLSNDDEKYSDLKKSFNQYKDAMYEELEPNALYEILIILNNGEEDWKKWPTKHQNLYEESNINTKEQIKNIYNDFIDYHIFKQWIITREIVNTNNNNLKNNIKIIADTPVAFTPAEVWLNKDLFLENFSLGCPPDFFSREGQRWGFAVLNPKKIFNSDGTLDKGGEFLKKKYENIFKNSPGGVRIDHLIGLIDPFVYLENEPHMNEHNSGRLYSSPHKDLLKEYCKYTDAEYSAIFEKIIIPAAEKYGITKESILCEDLGEKTPHVHKVMEKLGLTGLSVTQYGYSGFDAPEHNVIMLGAHDNQSYIEFTNDLFERSSQLGEGRDRFIYKTHILASDTADPSKDLNSYREEIRNDKKKFITASFTELFTSPAKKVQIFFTDFFGIGKTYNIPGTKKNCWTLRLQSDYENLYYENLKNNIGINLPEVIAQAIRHRGKDFSSKHTGLLRKLDYFTYILKN